MPASPYTLEEKARFIAEIQRQHRQGGRSYKAIANELGLSDSSYYNWVKAGIEPAVLPERTSTKRSAGHRPYRKDERERLTAEVSRLQAEGNSLVSACIAVGISHDSIRRWKSDTGSPPAMRPVEVSASLPVPSTALTIFTPKPAPETLTLSAPGGYRLEGLGIESAAALLRALA
jgi:hypothetical protein